MSVHMLDTGSNQYPCVVCGSQGTIIRNTPNPRVKCGSCGFVYDGSESKEMKDKGQLPDAPPQLQDPNPPTTDPGREPVRERDTESDRPSPVVTQSQVPRTPAFVFISRDRTITEFCGRRELKNIALKWQISDRTFDVFELQPRKVSAKVEVE